MAHWRWALETYQDINHKNITIFQVSVLHSQAKSGLFAIRKVYTCKKGCKIKTTQCLFRMMQDFKSSITPQHVPSLRSCE